jgi:lipoyl(octanoyl) transferase
MIQIRDLGRMPYRQALDIQRTEQSSVIQQRGEEGPMTVFFVEHDPPVITVSRRPGAQKHLLASPEVLIRRGIEVCETDRGGDITYHGPGQLVVYPILDLNRFSLRIGSYMRLLEQVVIDVLERFGVCGERDAGATGVWVRNGGTAHADASKIAAMGVRVSRWVSMHGLALNVDPDLTHFHLIVPCGLAGRSVTSLNQVLGAKCPDMASVKMEISKAIIARLDSLAASPSPCS